MAIDIGNAALRQKLGRMAGSVARKAAGRLGFDLVRRTTYSPVPVVPPQSDPIWRTRVDPVGFDLDPRVHVDFLESALAPYMTEFRPPLDDDGQGGFYLRNAYCSTVDAEVLYATIRHLKPERVLELGAGYSTLVIAAACARNGAEGHACDFVSVDPEPRLPLEGFRLEQRPVEQFPLERFLVLGAGDVLFVDTSHTVKLGSEVNRVVLQILPQLRDGVVVHFHDIYLPYEYPSVFFRRDEYLTEQYLLQAFLTLNPHFEIIFAAYAVARAFADRLSAIVPSLREIDDYQPSSFWFVRGKTAAIR